MTIIENIMEKLNNDREDVLIEGYEGDVEAISCRKTAQEIVKKVRDSCPLCKELALALKELMGRIDQHGAWIKAKQAIAHYEEKYNKPSPNTTYTIGTDPAGEERE